VSKASRCNCCLGQNAFWQRIEVICVFADYRINHQPITGQAFIDDPARQRRTLDSLLFAAFTGSLLAFGHQHEVFGPFDIQLLRSLVADHARFFATLAADALVGCAGDDLFDPRQINWQLLATGMDVCALA